jgi:hypothetical protein
MEDVEGDEEDNDSNEDEDEEGNESSGPDVDDDAPLITLKNQNKEIDSIAISSDMEDNSTDETHKGQVITVNPTVSVGDTIDNRFIVADKQQPSTSKEPVKKIVQKRPNTNTVPKKGTKVKTSKKILKSNDECSSVLRSVSATIQQISEKFMGSQNVEKEKPKEKDEITACVESLEIKLRTIKSRELRLKLIHGIDQLAFKTMMEDYFITENKKLMSTTNFGLQQNASVGYMPPTVQPITPPRQNYVFRNVPASHAQTNQQYMSAVTNYSVLPQSSISSVSQCQNRLMTDFSNTTQNPGPSCSTQTATVNTNKTPITSSSMSNPITSITLLTAPIDRNSTVDTSQLLNGASSDESSGSILLNSSMPF